MSNETVMMECGHAANATLSPNGTPACAICAPNARATTIVATPPNLTGRTARCVYAPSGGPRRKCQNERPSDTGLPFFAHNAEAPLDSFYCGCWGWD